MNIRLQKKAWKHMKFAIDRYNVGIETEVKADDFDGQTYIARRRDRFYCPECGEIVYFRAKGGSHPNQFYHQEKTERAPECDKRVDGRSALSLCQRVGLPLYISTIYPGVFQLSVGFPALGTEMLRKATNADYCVEISSGSKTRSFKVDNISFIADSVTLVPMDFVPTDGRNYNVRINGNRVIMGLKSKWSDYADGFDIGGAIFSYDGFGGKKVRRGDSISTNRSYYAVVRKKFPSNYNIEQEECGKLRVGNDLFYVLRIQINVSLDDKTQFAVIDKYLKSHFGVWLVECLPELIPLWPPVFQSESLSPVACKPKVCCAVSSSSAIPSVFVYSDSGVSEVKVNKSINGINTIDVRVGGRPVTLSVDRKYVGREVSFLMKSQPQCDFDYRFELGDRKGNRFPWKDINSKLLSDDFVVFSNSRMELYVGTSNKELRRFPLKSAETIVPAMKNSVELFFVVESRVVYHYRCDNRNAKHIENDSLCAQIQKIRCGQMVPIPRWAWSYICSLRIKHNEDLFTAIMSKTLNGKIDIRVLGLIRVMSLMKTNDFYCDREECGK